MAVIKCKMCGGDLVIEPGATVAECEYCGTKQTIPNQDDEKKLTLFARANRLRMGCEFDKAAGIYEAIVADFPQEAEAYWGLVLCKYGIEYVDDPATGKKIPTCHRSSFESIMEDSDFEQALENADVVARKVYRDEAKQIEEIRKGIIEVSGKEEPYDIFICYKETDENGQRTVDSVIAQDVYDALTEKGYRVFFSRITLEDKLGQEYEPYIFAALNSAKIMLAFGTDYEYYNAVWVKNEWSRYLKLMAKDKTKHLIPCYKGIDAYDMPKEFAKLQAQDMGKVGAIQDLMRGIEKILPRTQTQGGDSAPTIVYQPQPVAGGVQTDAMIKRGFMSLEDGAFEEAKKFFNDALNATPECADAYLGLYMVEIRARDKHTAEHTYVGKDEVKSRYWNRAMQFAEGALKAELEDWESQRKKRLLKIQQEREAEEKVRQEKIEKLSETRKKNAKFESLIETGGCTIGIKSNGSVIATGSNECGRCNVDGWCSIKAVSGCSDHTIGLKFDGTVVTTGSTIADQCDVSNWRNVVAISTNEYNTVGLKSDGTVVMVGIGARNVSDWENNVSDWKEIVAVSSAPFLVVGLKSNGTVVMEGRVAYDVSNWKDIVAVSTDDHIIGLKSDGTVVATGKNDYGQCNVDGWKDIVAIIAGSGYSIGLKSDGTVVVAGQNDHGQCNVSDWKDIVAISTDIYAEYTLGLKSDGTVVATGDNEYGQCNVEGWRDIVAISAGDCHSVGLKSDGTVVATGCNDEGECNVEGWKLFESEETLEQERTEAREQERKERAQREAEERKRAEEARREEEARAARRVAEKKTAIERTLVSLQQEKESLQAELANLRGLFTGKRRRQIEERIRQIDYEKERLEGEKT